MPRDFRGIFFALGSAVRTMVFPSRATALPPSTAWGRRGRATEFPPLLEDRTPASRPLGWSRMWYTESYQKKTATMQVASTKHSVSKRRHLNDKQHSITKFIWFCCCSS